MDAYSAPAECRPNVSLGEIMDMTGNQPLPVSDADVAAAALFEGKPDVRGKRVGVIISGGNVDLKNPAALPS